MLRDYVEIMIDLPPDNSAHFEERTKEDCFILPESESQLRLAQTSIISLFGTLDFWPDFDHKKLMAKS